MASSMLTETSIDNSGTDSKEELAEDRTEWAHHRTLLAKERTFSAWVRTGLASVAAGFATIKLLTDIEPSWLVTALGTLFTVTGGIIFMVGHWSYRKTLRKLAQADVRGAPSWLIGLITWALILGAGGGLWLIL